MQAPHKAHCDAALRVLSQGSFWPLLSVWLLSQGSPQPRSFDTIGLLSYYTTFSYGYFVSLSGSFVSWKTKKQQIISHSSSEVEYGSMTMILYELHWLHYLFCDLRIKINCYCSILLHCDS